VTIDGGPERVNGRSGEADGPSWTPPTESPTESPTRSLDTSPKSWWRQVPARQRIKVLFPSGMLGSGLSTEEVKRGVLLGAEAIAIDGGSTDSGPYYLGAAVAKTAGRAVADDMRILLLAAQRAGIPLIVGSCGTNGTDRGVDWVAKMVEDVATDERLSFTLACIYIRTSGPNLPRTTISELSGDKGASFRDMEWPDRTKLKVVSRPPAIVDVQSMSTEPLSIQTRQRQHEAVTRTSVVRCPGIQALLGAASVQSRLRRAGEPTPRLSTFDHLL
jgi:hypothetical protein